MSKGLIENKIAHLTDERRGLLQREYEVETADAAERVRFASEFSHNGIKGLFLANGGAIIALFTLVGNSGSLKPGPDDIWWAFALFVAGLALSLITSLFGYLAQNCFYLVSSAVASNASSELAGETPSKNPLPPLKKGNIALGAGVIAAVLGMVSFVAGAAFALASVLP